MALVFLPARLIEDGTRLGGAISAARGSIGFSSFGAGSGCEFVAIGVMGGGAIGWATSSGS
jgi:hypothetical protein